MVCLQPSRRLKHKNKVNFAPVYKLKTIKAKAQICPPTEKIQGAFE